MTTELLAAVHAQMQEAGVPYQYGVYRTEGALPEVYAVGHYSGSPVTEESGMLSGTFLLTLVGTSWAKLEQAHEKIRCSFPRIGGHRVFREAYGIVICYDNAVAVPCDDAAIKKIQVNLKCKEWSVN